MVPSRSRIVTASARLSRSSVSAGHPSRTRSPSELIGARSASAQRVLRRVDHREPVAHTSQAEQALHLGRSLHEAQAPFGVLRGLMSLDEQAQTGGVHELESAKV